MNMISQLKLKLLFIQRMNFLTGKMRNMTIRKPKLSIDEMGEAYELRIKGVSYENLGMIFGVSSRTIKKYIRQAEQFGFDYWTDWRNIDE